MPKPVPFAKTRLFLETLRYAWRAGRAKTDQARMANQLLAELASACLTVIIHGDDQAWKSMHRLLEMHLPREAIPDLIEQLQARRQASK